MTLYLRTHHLCVTCSHWQGVREDVLIAPDYLFSVGSHAGACSGQNDALETLPGQSCPRWVDWPDATGLMAVEEVLLAPQSSG